MVLAGAHAGREQLATVLHRGRGRRPARPPEHRPDLRGGRARRAAVLLARIRGRRESGRQAGRQADARGEGRRNDRDPGPGHGRGPRPRGHPPRPEARQRAADRRRRPQGHRLRPGQAAGVGLEPDPQRDADGDPELHGPRAGSRGHSRHRPAGGRLRAGGHPLRVPDRPDAVRGHLHRRHAQAGAEPGAGAAQPAAAEGPGGPRDDLPEVPAEGAEQAVRVGSGISRGPGPVPGRAADPGPADRHGRAGVAVVQAEPAGGRPLRRSIPPPGHRGDRFVRDGVPDLPGARGRRPGPRPGRPESPGRARGAGGSRPQCRRGEEGPCQGRRERQGRQRTVEAGPGNPSTAGRQSSGTVRGRPADPEAQEGLAADRDDRTEAGRAAARRSRTVPKRRWRRRT